MTGALQPPAAPRALMVSSAAILGAAGVALLFAPAELARLVAGSSPGTAQSATLPLQLWAAALLGLAAVDWIGRGLMLGGIYGRALVLGNLVHWFVAALVLLRAALDRPSAPALWAATALVGALAFLFYRLMRRHPEPSATAPQ